MGNDLPEAELDIFRLAAEGDIAGAISRLADRHGFPDEISAVLAVALVQHALAAEPPGPEDISIALEFAERADEDGGKLKAADVLSLAVGAWAAKPPKRRRRRGRPPRTVEEQLARALDGALAIRGERPRQARSDREMERCKAEGRAFFGPDLEEPRGEEYLLGLRLRGRR